MTALRHSILKRPRRLHGSQASQRCRPDRSESLSASRGMVLGCHEQIGNARRDYIIAASSERRVQAHDPSILRQVDRPNRCHHLSRAPFALAGVYWVLSSIRWTRNTATQAVFLARTRGRFLVPERTEQAGRKTTPRARVSNGAIPGRYPKVLEITRCLVSEGYSKEQIQGSVLKKQLTDLISKARVGTTRT